MFRAGLFNFSKGELAPALHGRIDVAAYSAALRRAENVVVLKYGGVTRRMGSRYVYELPVPAAGWDDAESAARLIPFEYSIEQTYMLVFTQAKMRPAALGGMVLEQALTIQAATNANPVQITAAYHGYTTGDEVYFADVEGMVEINGRTLPVTVIDGNTFTVPVDGTGWGAFTEDNGGVTNPGPPPAPPPPPPVPPPEPDPEPPTITPPGRYPGRNCVADDTLIMMADGTEKPARDLRVGDAVSTLHEATMIRGRYRIEALLFVHADVLAVELPAGRLVGTPEHRVWIADRWQTLRELGGKPAGRARIARITVADAHTYIANGTLSHNIKNVNEVEQ